MKTRIIIGVLAAAVAAMAADYGVIAFEKGVGAEPAAGEAMYARAVSPDATGTITIKEVHFGEPVYKEQTVEYHTVSNWIETVANATIQPVDVWTPRLATFTNRVYQISTNGVWALVDKVETITNFAHTVQMKSVTNYVDRYMSRPVTNTVVQRVIDHVATTTNDFCTITLADHFGQTTFTNKYLAGGRLITATTNAAISVIYRK